MTPAPEQTFDIWAVLLTTVKFLGVFVSGAGAIVGTMPDKTNPTKKSLPNSKYGRFFRETFSKKWALRWAIIGLFVSLCSQFVESIKSAHETADTANRAFRQANATQAELEHLRRIEFRQSPGSVEAKAIFSMTNAAIAKEFQWTKKIDRRPRHSTGLAGVLPVGWISDGSISGNKLNQVVVLPESPNHPLQQPRTVLSQVFDRTVLFIRLWRPTNSLPGSALQVLSSATTASNILEQTAGIGRAESSPGTGEFRLDFADSSANVRLVQPMALTEGLRSLKFEDLRNTLISVAPGMDFRPSEVWNDDHAAVALLKTISLDGITIRFGNLQIQLEKIENASRREFSTGHNHVTIFALPSTDEGLTNIVRSSLDPD